MNSVENANIATTVAQSASQPNLHAENHPLIADLRSVGIAKSKRVIVEKDVELLHNRIKMLQMEEQKAMKKIQETRQKAERIMELRKENDRKYEQKIRQQMKEQRQLKKKRNEKYTGTNYFPHTTSSPRIRNFVNFSNFLFGLEEQDRQKNIINKIVTIKNQRKGEAFVIRK